MLSEKVKLAYLQDMDNYELARPHDCLVEVFNNGPYTDEQIKKLLWIIPDNIFALGMQWSFSDTVVGDDIYTYILDNEDKVIKELEIV